MTTRPWIQACTVLCIALAVSSCSTDTADKSDSVSAASEHSPEGTTPTIVNATFEEDLRMLISIPAYREKENDADDEARFQTNMDKIRRFLNRRAVSFNASRSLKLIPFEWRGKGRYWVFGFRLGSGTRKISVLTHLDTVKADPDAEWAPFKLRRETRELNGKSMEFFVGRGTIDNRGPALAAFNVFKELALRLEQTNVPNDYTLELIFDTTEEIEKSIPDFFADEGPPEAGFVFDADWIVWAEKGIERSTFTLPNAASPKRGLWISRIDTPTGPTNQIPDTASMGIGGDTDALAGFAGVVKSVYEQALFDDPAYRKAPITVTGVGAELVLTASVAGAQHGSVPHHNRATGYNPLVSLVNFADYLAREKLVQPTAVSTMAQFIAQTWGTRVFGEGEADLYGYDEKVFTEGNGTTYAITRFNTLDSGIEFKVDIRYAIVHQGSPWNGTTFGMIPGEKNKFSDIFTKRVNAFNAHYDTRMTFTTETKSNPETRDKASQQFKRVLRAYEQVMGASCDPVAIGGGTDSKQLPQLIAAGPIFVTEGVDTMGPPINYHGINEAVPISWLEDSGRIYLHLLLDYVLDKSQ